MTIEEKAKAYDEALKEAVIAHKDEDRHLKATLERIFPELTESEDEKIRKEIISALKYANHKGVYDKHLAWLEKQGEQKPIINVPSREVILAIWDLGNEWKELTNGSISTEYGTQLYYIQKHWHESEYYLQKKQGEQKSAEWHKGDEQNLNACLGYIPDEYLRRWLIDVIHVKYDKPTDKIEPKFHKGQWIVWQDECYKVNYNGCGYELVDKNGLSILLDYGTIDENAHLWDITKDAKDGDVLVDKDDNIGIYEEIKGICWHSYIYLSFDNYLHGFSVGGSHVQNNTKPATKEQCDLLFQKMEEAGYMWNEDKKELKNIEQKSAWSEEDEKRLKRAIHIFEDNLENFENTGINDEIDESLISWLKTLKDRVQPKQEWSEEDWNYIADLISYFDGSSLQHDTPDVISWLKSLKPQTTWKPSEEQMKAIRLARSFVVDDFGEHPTLSEILMELEEQLKKLKG